MTMNKKTRNIIIGLIVVVLLGVITAVLVLTDDKGSTESSSSTAVLETETFPLIEENADNFTSLQITNETGSYEIIPTGNDETPYTIASLEQYTQASSMYDSVISSFSALNATNKVLDTVDDKARYGLDTPSATAVLTFGDASYTIYVGDEAANGAGYYAMLEGNDTLYTISSTNGDILMRSQLEYLDKTLLPAYESASDDSSTGSEDTALPNITELKITRPDLEQPIVLTKNDNTDNMYTSAFLMTSPITSDIDYEVDQTYAYNLFGLNANKVAAIYDESTAAQYGLDNPVCTIEMTYDNVHVKIVVGAETTDDTDGYYVLYNDNGLVYQVGKQSLPQVDVQPDDMISSLGIMPNITTVSTMDVVLNGESYTFQLTNVEEESEDDTSSAEPVYETTAVSCNGKNLDVDMYKKFYQLLLYPQIENINTTPVSGEPSLKVTFNYTAGGSDSMEFYQTEDSRRVQISINGEVKFEARSGYVDKVNTELQHLLNGETVDTDW